MSTATEQLTGRVEGLPFAGYLAADALSSTRLKAIWEGGTAAHGLVLTETMTEALVIGRACHCRTVRPDDYEREVVWAPNKTGYKSRTTAAYKEFAKEHPGKTVLLDKERIDIEIYSYAARSHPKVREYLQDGTAEVAYFAHDPEFGGIAEKILMDWQFADTGLDFKFMAECNPNRFRRDAIWKYHYDLQAAWYAHVFGLVTGKPLRRFYFIAVDKKLAAALHECGRPTCEAVAIYEMSESALNQGCEKWRAALGIWTEYLQAQSMGLDWAGYAQGAVEIE